MYGYQMTIDVGMLFRRMYCCKCGTKLKRRSTSRLIKEGELGYDYSRNFGCHYILGPLSAPQIHVRYVYVCPNCKQVTTYEQQCEIAKKQKQAKTKILEEKK